VTNPGTIPVTITSLVDDVYGNIGGAAFNGTCDDLIGDTLAPGGSASCSFVGPFTNATPASQTDVVTVTGTGNGQTVTADDDATVALVPLPPLSVVVDKTASPLSRPVPGGDFTFTVIVSNPGTVPLTITSLTDNIYGDIGAPSATSTCDDLIGTVLAPGANSAPCSFTRPFTGVAGASQTDIVTVIGTDSFGQTATDSDDATVTLTPRPAPLVQVDKTVTPGTRVEPGGDFTFSVVVSNPSTVPIVITSLVDDVYGNLATRGEPNTCDDLIGDTLAPGASTAPCTFTVTFTGVAGDTETDIVTVIAVDEIGQTVTDTDDAVITLTPRPPGPLSIELDKTATPGTMPEPGGTFTFNVVVTNTSNVPLTITTLTDDIYGNLGTRSGVNSCDDLIGDVLAPGASASCSFEGTFTGNAGDSQTDVVTVTGRDEDGRTVDDDDDAEVELTDVLPRIEVVKTATPLERTAPGGSFTFRVEVKNPGTEPIILTELTDDIYGDLNGKGTCDTGGTIAAGATYTCEFTAEFTGTAGQTQTDVVTGTGEDDEGNEVTDNDDAIVKLTPPPAASPTPSPTPTKSPTPPPAAPKPPAPLVRTGADFLPFFALALALISAGFVMRNRRPVTNDGRSPDRRRRNK
jgi:uncharacterized repeat protein (TIGR01451 family)